MRKGILTVFVFALAVISVTSANAQLVDRFEGTVVVYGSGMNTRLVTSDFNIVLNGRTSDAESDRYHQILKTSGQDKLAEELKKNDLGRVQFGSRLGPTVVAAFERPDGDKTRLMVVFERWITFGELRAGARSVDFPFGVFEIVFEPGKKNGEGTFIGAARVKLGEDDDGKEEIQLEGFGTFPGKVMGVRMTDRRAP